MIPMTFVLLIHSFYTADCCGGKDCKPVPCAEIVSTYDGFVWAHQNETIAFGRKLLRYSPDNDCHVCVARPEWSGASPYGVCIYLPTGI